MISAIFVVGDVSIYLDILTLEFGAIWERPPILLGYKQMLRQLLVLRILIVLIHYPLLWRQSFGTQTSPVQQKTE